MNFAEFRKKNAETAPVEKTNSQPVDSSNGGDEKEHQNGVLLKMKKAGVWVPRGPDVKTPGLTEASHHKVKIHFHGDRSEVRLVDDAELEALKRSNRVTKVIHVGREKDGTVLEYVINESEDGISYKHADGRKALVQTHKYKDPSLGEDQYVHIDGSRSTVFPHSEGLGKAHKLLTKLGFVKAQA